MASLINQHRCLKNSTMIPLNQLVYLRNHRPSNLFVFQAMPCNEATGTYNANGIEDFCILYLHLI
jgi:hypothetical protein